MPHTPAHHARAILETPKALALLASLNDCARAMITDNLALCIWFLNAFHSHDPLPPDGPACPGPEGGSV